MTVKVKATRDAVVPTLYGYSYSFRAGEVQEVHELALTDAIMAGCIPVEEAPAEDAPDLSPPDDMVPGMSAEDRLAAVSAVVAEILSKSETAAMGPEGYPKLATVKRRVKGFAPTLDEVIAATDALRA